MKTHSTYETLAYALYDAAREAGIQVGTLKREARRIAGTMADIPALADDLQTINPEGEIQGAALKIDRACALLDAARKHLLWIEVIARAAGFDDAAIAQAKEGRAL